MTIPATNVTMSSINRALNRTNTAQVNFSTQVLSVNSAYTLGSTRGRVKDYHCILKFDGTNGSTSIIDYTDTFVNYGSGGATLSSATSKFGGTSLRTNNQVTYVYLLNNPVNVNLNAYAGDWTIEGFCYWQGGGDIARFVSGFAGTYDSSIRIQYGQLHAYYFEPPNNEYRAAFLGGVPANEWFHFAFVKRSNIIRLYLNGNTDGSALGVGGEPMAMNFFYLGNSGVEYFDGYLDEIRFSPIARYNGNFTPPTASFA